MGDAKLNDMIDGLKAEFDSKKEQALTHKLSRYDTGQMFAVRVPVAAKFYTLTWPVIANASATSPRHRPRRRAVEYSTEAYARRWERRCAIFARPRTPPGCRSKVARAGLARPGT